MSPAFKIIPQRIKAKGDTTQHQQGTTNEVAGDWRDLRPLHKVKLCF